jgi:hypothetical protein
MCRVLVVVIASLLAMPLFAAAPDQPDSPQYELQVIHAKPGKLDEVHAWFRAHQQDVLAKHGAESMAYLVPAGPNPENKLLAIYKFSSLPAVLAFSRALKADPLWKPLDTASESPELLVERLEITSLSPTDYSPEFKPGKSSQPRVFELRTYTCPSPEKLFCLNSRFREHTMGLFKEHGMENLVYWHPLSCDNADRMLIYLLAHKSQDAAKESFAAFRKDPDWLAAKEASEKAAGGSLTEKEKGVVSEFLEATQYSPLK